MAKFTFRLQSFLGLKEKIEDQKKLEYGKAIRKLEEEREKKRQLQQESTKSMNELRIKAKTGITPYVYRQLDQYIVYLDNAIINQQHEIEKAEQFAESKRLELVTAIQERKTLETLKEKDYVIYLDEEKHKEQQITDEIVSFQYSKR